MPKIAIVGGGPSAISLCKQLCDGHDLHNLTDELEIIIFEKGKKIGAGLPYSFVDDAYILNLPKDIMEPVYNDTGHFSAWLLTQSDYSAGTLYPPRYFFGRYLEHLAKIIQEEVAHKGIKITYHTEDEVSDVREMQEGSIYEITARSGKYIANHIVFATGHMLSSNYLQLKGIKGYEHNPWDASLYARLNPDANVGIIGSRLTAIDAALKLKQINHRGKIYMISRMGMLPAVLTREIRTYPLRYLTLKNFSDLTQSGLTKLKLTDLVTLFWREISEAEGVEFNDDTIIKSSEEITALNWLTSEINRAEKNDSKWQQVLFAFYAVIPYVWSQLSFSDQQHFLKKYYGLFITYLAAFPLDNAYKILNMLKTERLEVLGGLTEIKPAKGGFVITLKNREIRIPQLINATGSGYQLSSAPLYKKLMARNFITEDSLGGIRVDPQTLQVLHRTGRPYQSVYAVGELTRGASLLTADMSRVSDQTKRVSTCLARNLQQQANLSHSNSFFSNGRHPRQSIHTQRGIYKTLVYARFFNNFSQAAGKVASVVTAAVLKRAGKRY
jgi:uncharacterized NAD(P)/FAD-binding protein YdhS